MLGTDGYDLEFTEQNIGNGSAIDSPLMDAIRAWIEREDPGARVVPIVLPAFTDSRTFRNAFPECVAYGFFPMRHTSLYEMWPLIHAPDERIDVRDLAFATQLLPRPHAGAARVRRARPPAARRHGARQRAARARTDVVGGRDPRRRRVDPDGVGAQAACAEDGGPRPRARAGS